MVITLILTSPLEDLVSQPETFDVRRVLAWAICLLKEPGPERQVPCEKGWKRIAFEGSLKVGPNWQQSDSRQPLVMHESCRIMLQPANCEVPSCFFLAAAELASQQPALSASPPMGF